MWIWRQERGGRGKLRKVMYWYQLMENSKTIIAHDHMHIEEWVVHARKEEDDSKTGEKILSLEARELLFDLNVRSLFCLCA